jgi:hypothetical protein
MSPGWLADRTSRPGLEYGTTDVLDPLFAEWMRRR